MTRIEITRTYPNGGSGYYNFYLTWREAAFKQAQREGRWFHVEEELAGIGARIRDDMFSTRQYIEFEDDSDASLFLLRWT